jgi:long-chain fatty acid transport protein
MAVLSGVALAALVAGQAAHAGGFALREQSAYGQGSSFAGMAAGGSLSSMFWNPATLSHVQGIEIEGVLTGVIPFAEVDYAAPAIAVPPTDADDIGEDAVVPAGYAAMRVNEQFVLGVGMNGPFGLATDYPDGPIKTFGVAGKADVFSLNFNPAISFQPTGWLALAVGAQIQYIDVDYTALGLPVLGITSLEGDDIAVGFTAGVTVMPFPGTEIGVGYRSFIDHELDGTLESQTLGVGFDATANGFDMPDLVSVGIRQRITDRFRVMAGAEWSNWSRFETVTVSIPGSDIPLPFDYEDGWFFSVGGEFDVMPNLSLRGGIGYELSPLDDGTRTFRLPDNDRLWLSAGASYHLNDRLSFDAGYSFIAADDTDILSAAAGGPIGNGPFSGSADTNIHIISAGVKLKLGGGLGGLAGR